MYQYKICIWRTVTNVYDSISHILNTECGFKMLFIIILFKTLLETFSELRIGKLEVCLG